MTATDRVLVFDEEAGRAAMIAASLNAADLATDRCHDPRDAVMVLRRVRPAVAVVVGGDGVFGGLAEAARGMRIPTLAVIEPAGDPASIAAKVREFEGWAFLNGPATEIPIRVAALLRSKKQEAPHPPIDPKFLGLIVHDLRTPLNVIGLTIRAIQMSVPQPTAEFEEDLTFLIENARQIEKMLAQLGDYCRLSEDGAGSFRSPFDPRRFLSDFLEDWKERPGGGSPPVGLELEESCPREVVLDEVRVRLAMQHAMANTAAAAGESPVRVKASGGPGRWVIELIIDRPPPETVGSLELRPELFERLIGVAAERRGLDLAIAAGVTRSFGGTARLVIEPGRRSTVVLDWPTS
ncbi:sensor histidine kinase [Tundrisphaera lichenicola]|uniref:sensor histidine kinase n=1 Tax=Tundrisphaera lichenicola TaxID=2029860 RepID=UPI003EB9C0CB